MHVVGKPILRVGKLKRSGNHSLAAVDHHLSRTVPTDNADPARTKDNVWLVGAPGDLTDAVGRVLSKAGIERAGMRKDATIANDVLLTISPAWFRPDDPDAAGTWHADKLDTFKREALAFLKQQFGPRLAAAVLHLDESTPHIQAVVVPVMKRSDGHRLSGRDYFNPERLTKLQDAWEKRLEPHGVGPREVGSTATHTTIKSYYSGRQTAPAIPEPLPPSPPPMRALLPGGSDSLAQWQAQEVAKVTKRQKPLAAAVGKGMLYDAERRSGNAMRGQMQDQAQCIARMREDLSKAVNDLALSKAQVAALRGVPVSQVAAALDYTGDIGKRENAIDLVRRVGELSFEDATKWLSIAFGPAAAGAAITHHTATVPLDNPVLTPADQVKARAVRKQLGALDAQEYRLTVMHQREDGTRYAVNLGKAKDDTPEQTWSAHQVESLIPRLTAENARGGNVFITPLDPATHHVLVDDVTIQDVQEMEAEGYTFATVTETSPGNLQAVVKVSKALPEHATNEWFKAVNRTRGDEKITGLIHPMRLAGFQNRKAKYEDTAGHFPFVRLVQAARGFCRHARAIIADMAQQMTAGSMPKI